MTWLWVSSLFRRRAGTVVLRATGIACAVALVATIGSFLGTSKATMTSRATRDVTVDWQVQVARGSDVNRVVDVTAHHVGVTKALPVGFASSPGFSSTTGATSQATGAGVVLGTPVGFASAFPGVIRNLTPVSDGALVFQQTASNLHVQLGDSVTIARAGLEPVVVRVGGIVDLPTADSLFQVVGAPAGSQPQAPPDNVILLDALQWHAAFDPVQAIQPDAVRTQVFAAVSHSLAHDPASAYSQVAGSGRNLEADLAGAGVLGNNLAVKLDAARSDALYAQVLFLFLGAPGVAIATVVTLVLLAAGKVRRREVAGRLRRRGATRRQMAMIVGGEALAYGAVGTVGGGVLGVILSMIVFRTSGSVSWFAIAGLVGAVLTIATLVFPALRELRQGSSDAHQRRSHFRREVVGAAVLLSGAWVVFRVTGSTSYSLVLAPEGSPAVSVNYWAFSGPVLFWSGVALATWSLVEGVSLFAPKLAALGSAKTAKAIIPEVATTIRTRRGRIAAIAIVVCLSVMFGVSTSVFNATYRQQAEADARLTNGADVTWTVSGSNVITNADAQAVQRINGVSRTSSVQHRFAYVGADLQDIYGIDTATIGSVGHLSNAYFPGSTSASVINRLRTTTDGVLVSAETVKDFQLHLGDLLHLRLPSRTGGPMMDVNFHYVGTVSEFPTAPKDSFLITNANYVASVTGDPSFNSVLIATTGRSPSAVAEDVRKLSGGAGAVSAIGTARQSVGSSLTSVDLSGLTRIELFFAVLFGVLSTSVLLGLSLVEQRRMLVIVRLLGGNRAQVSTFVRSEAMLSFIGGVVPGVAGGAVLAVGLTKVLKGVFDPPPSAVAIPWFYLLGVGALMTLAFVISVEVTARRAFREPVAALRRTS